MVYKKEVCEICLEKISHPICVECYLKHVSYWLRDLGPGFNIKKILSSIRSSLNMESLNESRCVVCGKQGVSVCTYCAFMKVSKIIVSLDMNPQAAENFEEVFNYKIDESPITEWQ